MINVKHEYDHYRDSDVFTALDTSLREVSIIVLDSNSELPNWMKISDLLTWPPEDTRKGYATAVLDAACAHAFKSNKNVYLFIGINQEIGINFFKKNGFEVLCMYDPDSDSDHFKKHSDDACFYVMIKGSNADYHELLEYLKKWSIYFGRSPGQ